MDHYIILDFEATCIENGRPKPQEIIEFPSVVMDVNTLEIIDQIQLYVKPVHHKILSKYCTNLTGIEQHTVDAANTFNSVFTEYNNWVWQYPNSVFITCGDWDLKTMLPQQCHTSKVKIPSCYKNWINIKREFEKHYNAKAGGLAGMLNYHNMKFIGRPHSGLDDCVNTARIWKKCSMMAISLRR